MAWSTPRTWVAGETVTASIMNSHVRDQFKAVGDSATNYTPSWTASSTNPVLGNGVLTGRYQLPGKWCRGSFQLTAGSTTTFGSGYWIFSLPVACVYGINGPFESAGMAFHASQFHMFSRLLTSASVVVDNATNNALLSGTAPFTWASTDTLSMPFSYEVA